MRLLWRLGYRVLAPAAHYGAWWRWLCFRGALWCAAKLAQQKR